MTTEAELRDDKREQLRQALKVLDEAEASIMVSMKPLRLAMDGVATAREVLLEGQGIEPVGECEGCSKLLISGDKGFRCDDGPLLCEAHSPTWGDAEGQWLEKKPETLDDFDRERREQFFKEFGEHLERGGSRDDSLAYEL